MPLIKQTRPHETTIRPEVRAVTYLAVHSGLSR